MKEPIILPRNGKATIANTSQYAKCIESLSQPTKNDGYTNTNVGTAYEIIGNVKDFTLLPCKDLTPATYL
ncbi:Hypothetical Protein SiL_0127 [Sulfolobus islandicus LAL14/1]|uniref:Uncharacterized protein n=1 Tax=Saccharolobus islandicus LAL14/1 TaxID=1241935 RepID=M9UAQ1_SACIS|nr:Hypothetical Protein SiL_0127 [Sulfolobus islandicus LAL14/1]